MRAVPLGCAVVAAYAAAALPARAEFSRTGTSVVKDGLVRETWRDDGINARIHLVRVNLTAAALTLVATREADKGRKTTQYAAAKTAEVAINGGPFAVAGFTPRGLTMGEGALWTGTADDASMSVLHFRRQGEQTSAVIVPPEEVTAAASLPQGTEGVLSGRPLLVRAGVATPPPDCNDPIAIPCTRAPRTAVGLSADGNTMWLAVADGWQASSAGVTALEMGRFLQARGAHMAMNLDVGGSSTLVVPSAGGIVSSPSDGVERAVANHLAVQFKVLQPGEVIGFICENTFSPCSTPIQGATVLFDDGRMQTSAADGRYQFTMVTPRLACATARKAGYRSNSRCNYVSPGETQFNSIALMKGMDPPDAGVPPDGPGVPEDAAVNGDGGTRPDAGMMDPGGAGCCDAKRDRPPAWLAALVAALAFGSVRRRGKKA